MSLTDDSPDCRICDQPLSLTPGDEWPEDGPICYGCLADEAERLQASSAWPTARRTNSTDGKARAMMNETHDTETPATAEPAFDTLVASFLSTASPPVQAWLIRSLARDAFVTAFAGFVFGVASTIVLAVGIVVAAPWFTSRAGRPKPAPEPHHMMVLTKDASGKLILHDPGGYDPRTGLPMSREEAIEAMEGIRP